MKKILLAIVALVVVFAGVVATRPAEFRLERSLKMAASPASTYAQVEDFHRWEAWSPWAKLDPSMKTKYDGPASGNGSSYWWSGNDKVGEGRMTITGVKPAEQVTIKLEFLKPFEQTNTTTFNFKGEGEGTTVSWAMEGKNNFMGKAFSLFMDMDKMVGSDFEKGLVAMKTAAEAAEKEKRAAEAAAAAAAAAAKAAAETPVQIVMSKDGKLTMDGAPATEAELTAALKSKLATNAELKVNVRGDGAPNKKLVALVDAVKASGVTAVALADK